MRLEREKLLELNVEELLSLSEKTTDEFRWNRQEIYRIAQQKFQEMGRHQEVEEMEHEIHAFLWNPLFGKSQGRFSLLVKLANDPERREQEEAAHPTLPEKEIDYYKKRSLSTNNPLLKCRYSDIVWEFAKDPAFGCFAVEAYLDASQIFLNNEWDNELADALSRSLTIALMLNKVDLIERSLSSHQEIVESLKKNRRFRYSLEIIASLLRNSKKLKGKIDFEFCETALESAVSYYAESSPIKFHLMRSFLEKLLLLWRMRKNTEKVKETQTRIADSFIDEAEVKKKKDVTGPLIAAHFYEMAMREYMNLEGSQAKVEELKAKIQNANEVAQKKGFPKIPVTVRIPKENIDSFWEKYARLEVSEIFQLMSLDRDLVPSYEHSRTSATKQAEKFVVQHIMPFSLLQGGIRIRSSSGEEEKLEFQAIQNFARGYKIISKVFLAKIFSELEERDTDFLTQLSTFFSSSEIVNEERLRVLEYGLQAIKADNHLVASHILVFQLEGVLRDLLRKLGLPTFSFDHGSNKMREKLLPKVLEELQESSGIDFNLLKFIEVLLCDNRGDNLRNKIAHGLLPIEGFTKENNWLLLLVLIKLCAYQLEEKKKEIIEK